jgi:hypothetical protein
MSELLFRVFKPVNGNPTTEVDETLHPDTPKFRFRKCVIVRRENGPMTYPINCLVGLCDGHKHYHVSKRITKEKGIIRVTAHCDEHGPCLETREQLGREQFSTSILSIHERVAYKRAKGKRLTSSEWIEFTLIDWGFRHLEFKDVM